MYKNIIDLIEQAAGHYSDKVFSTDVFGQITYGAFREKARIAGNQIRAKLGTDASEAGYPIAIFGEKSNDLLTLMMGSVYAGAFYVVLNPEQPAERLNQILSVLDPKALIVSPDMACRASELDFHCVTMDYSDLLEPTAESVSAAAGIDSQGYISRIPNGDTPLYGIFTSGSTGTPKCVLISHQDVVDFIGHFVTTFHFDETCVIGNQAPFDFDVSVKDIYTALFAGASLVLIPREYFSTPPRLLDYLSDHHVTNLTWAVSALCIISGLKGFSYRVPTDIRRVMFSGEVMPIRQLRIWQENLPEASFVNLYGPTEITCNCMYYEIPNPYVSDHALPLGIPFAGRSIVLEDNGQVVAGPGARGEICVRGESLALGYYHNPEQTDSHFIMEHVTGKMLTNGETGELTEIPAADGPMVRTYHTGDLAEVGPDGQIYFAGRKDFQIKHMGHRIELEEIEKDVEEIDGVTRCICSYHQERQRINAYFTGSIDKKELHRRLKVLLPAYMIPNRFHHVEEFRLNKNGKVDRKVLEELIEI